MWKRAAELDRLDVVPDVGIDSAAVEDGAVEAGLSARAVTTALAELRLGLLGGAGGRGRPRRPSPRDRR